MNIIHQADKIVVGYGSCIVGDTYRRGAYAEWFVKNTPRENWPMVDTPLDYQAGEIIRINSAIETDDGLPPGPWSRVLSLNCISDRNGRHVCVLDSQCGKVCDYVVRCGSPAVRKIMHQFSDEQLETLSQCAGFKSATIRMENDHFVKISVVTP